MFCLIYCIIYLMYGYIKGVVIAKIPRKKDYNLVVFPGKLTDYGVGYSIVVGRRLASSITIEKDVSLWLYSYSTERDSYILGFKTLEELKVFQQILGVSGIGPKVALSIVDFFESVDKLIEVIKNKDTQSLSKVPGLGKKSSAKIVVSLAVRLDDLDFLDENNGLESNPQIKLLVATLKQLGFSARDIDLLLQKNMQKLDKMVQNNASVDAMLKLVLKNK